MYNSRYESHDSGQNAVQSKSETPINVAPKNATTNNPSANSVPPKTTTAKPVADPLHYSTESDVSVGNGALHKVEVNDAVLTPATVTIKVGDTVVFRNMGTKDFRIVSDTYKAFDSVDAVSPGQLFQFKFTQVGNWVYRNTLAMPNSTGTIIVTK